MDINLPLERENGGACWTCLKHRRNCDATLPRCRTCSKHSSRCSGYSIRLSLLDGTMVPKRNRPKSTRLPRIHSPANSIPESMSTLGLPAEQSFLMQHFTQNIARVALAIDYHGNGYRRLVPMAMSDPALLNVALAVAASHHSRWQHTADETSQKYLRASCKALKQRFTNPTLINDPETLASMLLLTTYEVFAGSSRWKNHHDAIRSWIRSRGDCAGLDPFLKNWVCLLDTQSSLNLGTATMPELDSWMDATTDQRETVDTLFGCSAKLPKLMSAASRLYVESKDPEIAIDEIRRKADILQDQIHATKIAPDTFPMIGLSCHSTVEAFSTTIGMDEDELRRRAVATAEIFRHASHIFVHRITHGPEETLPSEMRESLESAMQLLPLVPDALGPGANLGWCLVVLGAELDAVDQREYITSRWVGLHLLGIYNTKNGQKLLDEVWSHADLVRRGYATSERWQDTMLRIGQAQILV